MHKWALATALGLWIGLCSVSLEAQNRSDNIGVLLAGGPSNNVRNLDALRDGLRNYGWTEGNNVNITPVYAMGDYSRLPALAKELVDQKVRIILAGNERSLIASKDTALIFRLWLLPAIRSKSSSAASRDPAEMRRGLAVFRQTLSGNGLITYERSCLTLNV